MDVNGTFTTALGFSSDMFVEESPAEFHKDVAAGVYGQAGLLKTTLINASFY